MIKRFGVNIYDWPEWAGKTWEVGKDVQILKLLDSTLYVNNMNEARHILFNNVTCFDVSSSSLCTSSKDSTVIYSFDLQPIHTSQLQMLKVAAGARHFIAFDRFGRAFGLGSNLHGQLGMHGMDISDWKIIQTLDGLKVIDIAAGDLFSLFLTESGVLFACGNNDFGQLGVPLIGFENIGQNIPKPVFESPCGSKMRIAAGSRHSLLLVDNIVYGSGWSKYGQLGENMDQIRGFKHIFTNFLVLNVDANNWETILEVDKVSEL